MFLEGRSTCARKGGFAQAATEELHLPNPVLIDILRPNMNTLFAHSHHHAHHHMPPKDRWFLCAYLDR